jgi:predicted nucleotide-binding protein (sugar kinase/HSP70/actin superfamily)
VLSPRTNNRIVLSGVESMTAETCFPVKVFHGHVHHLMNAVDFLFLPTVINMPTPESEENGLFCPLLQGSQYMVRSALRIPDQRLIRPVLFLKEGFESAAESLYESLPRLLRPSKATVLRETARAWERQLAFRRSLFARGREILRETPGTQPLWIVTGRPYNLHDERLNLQLGRHLAKLGIRALPMDYCEVDDTDLSDFPRMYWGLGARILRTAKRIADTPSWYGVHLSNFSCGPDSFIEHFYRQTLQDKPSLVLELDEHSGVAGLLTRIEAYRNVVKNLQQREFAAEDAACQPFEALCP